MDYKVYPDGVQGLEGGQITGGLTVRSARDLAAQLRLPWLPVNLKLIGALPQR